MSALTLRQKWMVGMSAVNLRQSLKTLVPSLIPDTSMLRRLLLPCISDHCARRRGSQPCHVACTTLPAPSHPPYGQRANNPNCHALEARLQLPKERAFCLFSTLLDCGLHCIAQQMVVLCLFKPVSSPPSPPLLSFHKHNALTFGQSGWMGTQQHSFCLFATVFCFQPKVLPGITKNQGLLASRSRNKKP